MIPRQFQISMSLFLSSAFLFLLNPPLSYSQSEAEHLSHHPELAAQAGAVLSPGSATPNTPVTPSGPVTGAVSPTAAGGMMAGMGEMMKQMGLPPKKDFYPSLMELPNLTPEKWDDIQKVAHARMVDGLGQVSTGLGSLSKAVDADNFALMQQSLSEIRQGIQIVESGVSAHRLLAEGEPPRNIALNWFKTEMNLSSSNTQDAHTLFGVTPFHLFTMALLILFALTMLIMYSFKMRRAAALFGRIDPDAKPPSGGLTPSGGIPSSSKSTPAAPKTNQAPNNPPVSSNLKPPVTSSGIPEATAAPPVTANWKGRLQIESISAETSSLKTFRLVPLANERFLPFTFIPGQFLNVAFWIGGAKMNRSYSIASSPTQRDYIELAIRREPRGAISRHINDLLKVGDEIELNGPVGKFTFTGTESDSIVLISAGVGITPMMSITRYLTEIKWSGEIYFVFSGRIPADFIFAEESVRLQGINPNLHVAVTVTKPEGTDWRGAHGRITKEWLTQVVPDLASRRTHLCGPQSMMDSVKAIFSELEISPENLKTEAFGATKPAPATPGSTAKPTAPATGPLVTFLKNNKASKIRVDLTSGDSPPRQTILELSEELDIPIEFSCRVGTCGLCKVKMTSGEVEMAVQDSLEANDKANGVILACQAKPKTEVTLEA